MGNSVRGTPVRSIGPTSNTGLRGGSDGGQTQQGGYAESGINSKPSQGGAPEHYKAGNPDNAKKVDSQGKYGKVVSEHGLDMNDANANGNGVILDSVANDYEDPNAAPTLDSPVPAGAPRFQTGNIAARNAIALGGSGSARDSILENGGVMSRGMVSTSTPGGPETELLADDVLPSTPPA